MIQWRNILWLVGVLMLILSGLMLIPLVLGWITERELTHGFLKSIIVTASAGGLLQFLRPIHPKLGKREGFLIVSLGWMGLCLAGSLPYIFGGFIHHPMDAFFESTSGFTTTGATVFSDIEALPQSILLWRSMTQWIGGMGIIVLTVAIMPFLGVSGVELFVAEAPGPKSQKIHPKIKDTAKILWFIYLGLTFVLFLILWILSGMTLFDAINHALTTISTGGFSTKNASIAHYASGWVMYPILLFMLIGGMNYTVIYFVLRGKFSRVWASDEFRTYLYLVLAFVVVCTVAVYSMMSFSWEESFRLSAFQIVSMVTTTGFVVTDYTQWGGGFRVFFFFLLFTGACAGSTSGGIKVIRHLAFAKNTLLEFKRLLHPRAIIRMKIDGSLVAPRVLTHILVFLLVYLSLLFVGSMLLSALLHDDSISFLTTLGAVATCLGNVGPAIGEVGPVDHFGDLPHLAKLLLSFLMIVGRLELFTVLIIFTPFFWRTN